MGVRLFVGNLDYSVSETELRDYFSSVGEPSQVALPVDRETGRPRGFAFVEFTDRAVAEEAIRRFNGQQLKGRTIAVSEARAREERPFSPRPPGPRPPYTPGGPPGGGGMGGGGGLGGPRPPMRGPDGPPGDFSSRGGGPPGARERRPPANKAKAKPERGGPRGPIRERAGGRVLDIDGVDEADVEVEFDDFATSGPPTEPEDENE